MTKRGILGLALVVVLSHAAACALARPSPWKVQGGPKECMDMCRAWDLEFVGMVGVGDQGRTSDGASACVCQVRKAAVAAESAAAATAIGAVVAGPIKSAQTEAAEAGGP